MFFGLGSDGTVGANKSSVKIIGEQTDLFAQGYFVYDSKKSGSVTISHLRFGPQPIRSTYLIDDADFVACHQFGLLEKMKVVEYAKAGATMLLNSPWPAATVWDHLPEEVQRELIAKDITLYVIDADEVARATGMANRVNTVMQPCFFALSGVLPADEAIGHIKASVEATYGKRGRSIVERNFAAIDASLAALERVEIPSAVTSTTTRLNPIPADAPEFVRRVTAALLAGEGDLLPVSALPIDGVFPTGTAKYEKRSIASEIPIFDPDVCIDCGRCAAVCPHAAIRMKVYEPDALAGAPAGFRSKAFRSKDVQGQWMSIQVAPDDCTGCGVCVDVCPAKSKSEVRHKAINMSPAAEHRDVERVSWDFFLTIPEIDRDALPHDAVKGSQALQPLFEFSGACAGCGETPYIKLVTQLFGDRMIVANATGCSSIFGANLPTTPYAMNDEGRGPVWSNSLFEDNAEFGLGMRLGYEAQRSQARLLLERLAPRLDASLVNELLIADQSTAAAIRAQRQRVATLIETLATFPDDLDAAHLRSVAEALVDKGVWIIGGDGWAYDIGFGGLDQVLSSGRNVNILVLDTEVYSNTGGQASKATPRGAVAKFAASGKSSGKKDLGAIARSYGNVYVAQIAIGSNDLQATKAMVEAEAWPGPSLVIAYSTCIAHGIEMSTSMSHQKDAVRSGYWPLYRFSPSAAEDGTPFQLDSKAPTIPVSEFVASEARFAILARTNPERAAELGALLQGDADERWRYYSQLATVRRSLPHTVEAVPVRTIRRCPAGAHTGNRGRNERSPMTDLTTKYLGLTLRTPIVASAGPLTREVDLIRRLVDSGASAIVLPSLFEEEILLEERQLDAAVEAGTNHFAEALDYFPNDVFAGYENPLDRYLGHLAAVRDAVDVPVIASINATSAGAWTSYARLLADAGADALELNLYHVAADPARSGRDVEEGDAALVMQISSSVRDPRGGEDLAVLLVALPHRVLIRRRRRRRAGVLQPLLPTRPRPRHTRGDAVRRPLGAVGAPAAAALDRDPASPAAGDLARRDNRHLDRARRRKGAPRRRRRGDDDVGVVASWPGARRPGRIGAPSSGPPSTSTTRSTNSGAASATPRQTIPRRSKGRTTCTSSSRTRPRAWSAPDTPSATACRTTEVARVRTHPRAARRSHEPADKSQYPDSARRGRPSTAR